MNNKYYLMLCELHNPLIHGKTIDSDPNIETHYLVFDKYDPYTYNSYTHNTHSNDNIGNCVRINYDINRLAYKYYLFIQYTNQLFGTNFIKHPTIRNYTNIINRNNYIKAEIGQCIILPTQEEIAILKTFWLRIIQRKWKKIFAERKQIILNRMHPDALYFRRVYGKWPEDCNYFPGLKGMLIIV